MQVIGIKWAGVEYTINEDEVFLACDAIEGVMTLGELAEALQDPSKIRFARLAGAYAALLQEAGANVDRRDIHKAFRSEISLGAAGSMAKAREVIASLIAILMDGSELSQGDKEPKNVEGS